MPRGCPSWTSHFDRILIDFGTQLGPPNLEKSSPRCRESRMFQKIAFRNRHRFVIDVGENLPPTSLQKPILKGVELLIDVDIDVYTILARTWSHLGPHDSSPSQSPRHPSTWRAEESKRVGPWPPCHVKRDVHRCFSMFLVCC